jgi:multidrug efflux pump
MLKRAARYLVIYAAIAGVVVLFYTRLPTSFLPQEDQGYMLVNVQLPPGATLERTLSVMEQVEGFMLKQPEVQSMVGVLGFSFSGQGQNAALAFVTLKDWKERKAKAFRRRAGGACLRRAVGHPRCLHLPAQPAADSRAGHGFGLQLPPAGPRRQRPRRTGRRAQPAAGHGRPEQGADAGAARRPGRRAAAADGHRPRQGQRAGRSFDAINSLLSTALGSAYVNDFPNRGRLQRVVVQADAPARMQPEDLLRLNVVNTRARRAAVGLRHHALDHRRDADGALQRLPRDAHLRRPAPGYSTGAAMDEMEKLAAQLPPASASSGPASRARKSSPARRR